MNKITKLNRLLESLDLYGQPISFYIKGHTKYKTSFGGIITLIILGIIMIVTINSLFILFSKSDMSASKETMYELNPPYLNLTQQNFMFSIGVNNQKITLNNSIFSLKAVLVSTNQTDEEETFLPIDLRPCQAEDYATIKYELKINFGNYLCPSNFSYGINGTYSNIIHQNVKLLISQCINGSNPYVTCASKDFINEYTQKYGFVQVYLYFMNRVVDLQNQEIPYKTFLDFESWNVNPTGQLIYDTNIFLRLNQILSYDDILGIAPPKKYDIITYEKERMDNAILPTINSTKYAKINLISSNYKNYYRRTYDNLLNVLSYIGGILNMISGFAGCVVGLFNTYKYRMKMLNELYDFDIKQQEDSNIQSNNSSMCNLNESQNSSTKVQINKEFNSFLVKQKFDEMKIRRSKLIFTLRDFCRHLCHFTKSNFIKIKIQLFYLANTQLAKDMDIIWIMKRIRDIDKLKTILLYPDKLKIFEFISSPIISINHSHHSNHQGKDLYNAIKYMRRNMIANEKVNKMNSSIKCSRLLCQDLDQYYECNEIYNDLKNKEDQISQNIMMSLDPEITQIFECIEEMKNIDRTVQKLEGDRMTRDTAQTLAINNIPEHTKVIKSKENNNSNHTMMTTNDQEKKRLGELDLQINPYIGQEKTLDDDSNHDKIRPNENIWDKVQAQQPFRLNPICNLFPDTVHIEHKNFCDVNIKAQSEEEEGKINKISSHYKQNYQTNIFQV